MLAFSYQGAEASGVDTFEIHFEGGGDCRAIGSWDQESLTCKLDVNPPLGIRITSDGITLDGNNKSITGLGCESGSGIIVVGREGVTIEDISVSRFFNGIALPIV